jgi:hypothetical protein
MDTLYRYESLFRESRKPHSITSPTSLSSTVDSSSALTAPKKARQEALPRRLLPQRQQAPTVPNPPLLRREETETLRTLTVTPSVRKKRSRGLIRILNRYKFTIVENTPDRSGNRPRPRTVRQGLREPPRVLQRGNQDHRPQADRFLLHPAPHRGLHGGRVPQGPPHPRPRGKGSHEGTRRPRRTRPPLRLHRERARVYSA